MYKKKRGQITVYIILGIIILSSAILLFYLRGRTEGEMGMQEIVRAQKIPKEARPITNYVTTQLDDATKKGLYLIGRQGGYIYYNQGGPIEIEDPIEGTDFVFYDEHNVSYGIYKYKEIISSYHIPTPRYYPWAFYPYLSKKTLGKKEVFGGFFGTSYLPPLNGSLPSIQAQLEYFITNYLEKKIDFSIFDRQGFEINDGEINVSVIIGENDVIAFLEYPLGIKKKITNTITNVTYFYTNPQIRLKKVYDFTDFIINKDITHILFDINDSKNNRDGIGVNKTENAYNNDDIITVYDNKSLLYTEPYEFRFARENRYPALRYNLFIKKTFHDIQAVMGAILTESDIDPIPKADDPDEDVIVFTYDPHLPYTVKQSDFGRGYIILTIYAYEEDNPDPSYKDWQKLNISIMGYSEV